MSTKMLIAAVVVVLNFWLVFGCVMPVPEMVSDICAMMLRAEAWTIGLCLVFSVLFFYDQMVLVVEQHKLRCGQVCRIWSRVTVPDPKDLGVREMVREAWIISMEKVVHAQQRVHRFLQNV